MADLLAGPPPRWRVVERDRRLVVIDLRGGASTADPAPAANWLPRQVQFDGSAELVTRSFYDDKAPRTIRLDPGSAALVNRLKLVAIGLAVVGILLATTAPWLLVLPGIVLANPKVRRPVRAAVTRWLDTVAREAS